MGQHTVDRTTAGSTDTTPRRHPGRRGVLRAGAAVPVGVGLTTLAACGSEESAGSAEPASSGASADGFPTADVPVGGATYDKDSETVYTQPTTGEFRAFDSTCPHQGCAVSEFSDGQMLCPCHSSTFDVDTGEVVAGPSPSGLTPRDVTVNGADLVLG